jgi:hypothetical protein
LRHGSSQLMSLWQILRGGQWDGEVAREFWEIECDVRISPPWALGPVREETVVGGVRLCDLEAEICSFVGVCGRRCVVLQELDVGVCLNDRVRPIVPA